MKGDKIIYKQTFKNAKIASDLLPVLKHLKAGFAVRRAELLAAGVMRLPDGKEVEYQDIRVYIV